MLKRFVLMFGLMVLVVGALAACGGGDDDDDSSNGGSSNGGGSGTTIEINMTEMAFDPSTVTLTAGEEVTFVAKNDGSVVHDFTIEDFGGERVHLVADPGESAEGTFTVPEAGTYEFICTQPGHAAAGMTGELTVE